MSVKPLVTITRQYASGGSEIGRLVVDRLGWTLIDNEFIDQVARLAGLPRDEVARREERAPGLLERLARTLAVASPEMFITTGEMPIPVETEEDTLVTMTERVIAEAAAEGRVVLVGRGAQAVLATRPNALHVYVIASKPFRKKVAVERLGVDPATVDKVLDETDQQRDEYVKTHYGRDRQDLTQYDLVLNAERLGFEGAADVIVAEVRRRGWTEPSTRRS
ncbi:MAG TPA: cytidylate kinase-like family protein [Gemmatimonadales bacterium]|nr:cytidylate kinase-like family protein [Gemmatimonadales bacterium]